MQDVIKIKMPQEDVQLCACEGSKWERERGWGGRILACLVDVSTGADVNLNYFFNAEDQSNTIDYRSTIDNRSLTNFKASLSLVTSPSASSSPYTNQIRNVKYLKPFSSN